MLDMNADETILAPAEERLSAKKVVAWRGGSLFRVSVARCGDCRRSRAAGDPPYCEPRVCLGQF